MSNYCIYLVMQEREIRLHLVRLSESYLDDTPQSAHRGITPNEIYGAAHFDFYTGHWWLVLATFLIRPFID